MTADVHTLPSAARVEDDPLRRGFPSVRGCPIELRPFLAPFEVECLRAIGEGCDSHSSVHRRMIALGLLGPGITGNGILAIDRAMGRLSTVRLAKPPRYLYDRGWKLYAAGRRLLAQAADARDAAREG